MIPQIHVNGVHIGHNLNRTTLLTVQNNTPPRQQGEPILLSLAKTAEYNGQSAAGYYPPLVRPINVSSADRGG